MVMLQSIIISYTSGQLERSIKPILISCYNFTQLGGPDFILFAPPCASKLGGRSFFFCPNAQVLLENACFRFEPVGANLLRGQNGHFWAQNGVFELFEALERPKSVLGGPILLATAIQVIIYLGLQGEGFGVKKNALWSTLKIAIFGQNPGFEAVLAF